MWKEEVQNPYRTHSRSCHVAIVEDEGREKVKTCTRHNYCLKFKKKLRRQFRKSLFFESWTTRMWIVRILKNTFCSSFTSYRFEKITIIFISSYKNSNLKNCLKNRFELDSNIEPREFKYFKSKFKKYVENEIRISNHKNSNNWN